jgi:hypothetical protein
MQSEIILPRRDVNGEYYLSYSQLSTWKEMKSFNMGVLGEIEYMASYFLGRKWPDQGWALFGEQVEGYVCEKQYAEFFTEKEKVTLDKVTPLGVFQTEVKYYILPNVYILGYIDDRQSDWLKLRDYKTASNNSRARYYKDDYYQLDIYALEAMEKNGGVIPELEVCIIERKGNCFGLVERRDLLSVGDVIWYHTRESNHERLNLVREILIKTITQISDAYKVYLKINK